jgi:hypothetical protein
MLKIVHAPKKSYQIQMMVQKNALGYRLLMIQNIIAFMILVQRDAKKKHVKIYQTMNVLVFNHMIKQNYAWIIMKANAN